MTTRIEDLDPSIRPIIERAWQAFMEGERLDSVTMTESEFEVFWKTLGYTAAPPMMILYDVPVTVTPDRQ
jgi:hypothetical protein